MASVLGARQSSGEESIDHWMAERAAHLERMENGGYEAGRQLWSQSTRTGGNIAAVRPSDVAALGLARPPQPARSPTLSPDMRELRRQQAAFKEVTRQLDHDNRWMAAVALAPIAAVGGLEAVPYGIAQQFLDNPPGEPLQLPGRQPLLKNGDTHFARYGRRKDMAFREKVSAKSGWTPQPRVYDQGRLKIPDAQAPVRPDRKPKFLELKPDTPSGRRAGKAALEKYKNLGITRIVYYRRPSK